MFSTGQTIFAILFILGFTTILFFMYRKDKKLHQKNYKGVKVVVLTFIGFVVFLFIIKHLLKN